MRKTSSLEQAIQVVSTLAIENIYLDKSSKKNLIAVVNGEKTTQEILTESNKKYNLTDKKH